MTPESHDQLEVVLVEQIDPRFAADVNLDLIERVIERALLNEGIGRVVEVGLIVTDDEEIRKLNAAHRGIDAPTDVLSFPLAALDETDGFVRPPDLPLHLGDIVISFPRVQEQAREYGHSVERELGYLTVHGLLHLLGYDHENEEERQVMRAKEEAALAR